MLRKEDLKDASLILGEIYDTLNSKPTLELNTLDSNRTVLIIVDMINGFARIGALKSPRVEGLIPVIAKLLIACGKLGIKKLIFADSHTNESPEFNSYPCHCLKDSEEAEIVSELAEIGGYELITKNSTNGFLEQLFQEWLKQNKNIDTFIVVGDCTDICIQQFATTLKTHFNRLNLKSRIIVPINAVDTYDLGVHNGNLMHMIALYQMMMNDIEIVKEIK